MQELPQGTETRWCSPDSGRGFHLGGGKGNGGVGAGRYPVILTFRFVMSVMYCVNVFRENECVYSLCDGTRKIMKRESEAGRQRTWKEADERERHFTAHWGFPTGTWLRKARKPGPLGGSVG